MTSDGIALQMTFFFFFLHFFFCSIDDSAETECVYTLNLTKMLFVHRLGGRFVFFSYIFVHFLFGWSSQLLSLWPIGDSGRQRSPAAVPGIEWPDHSLESNNTKRNQRRNQAHTQLANEKVHCWLSLLFTLSFVINHVERLVIAFSFVSGRSRFSLCYTQQRHWCRSLSGRLVRQCDWIYCIIYIWICEIRHARHQNSVIAHSAK